MASHKLEEQSDSSSKQTIIALALITALCLAGDAMLYIVLPTQWKEIGLTSLVQVGMLLSINRFVRLPLNPLIGYIYKKVNFRKVILIAVVLSGISTVGYGIVADFRIWIILRATWGIAWALFKLGGYLLILQLSTDTNRGNLVGTYNGLFNLGSLVGMLIGGFFADLFGLKIISIVLGTLAFFCISFVFKYIPKAIYTNENQVKKVKTSLIRNLKINMNKTIVKILFTALLFNMLLMGMLTAILSHIIDIKLTNEIELVGIVIGAATVAGIIQALRWGVLPFITPKVGSILDKTKQKNTLLEVFLVCSAIFLFLIPLPIHLGIWLPILFINLIIASIINTIIDSIITDCASRVNNKVFIMTIYAIVVDFGSALGPITGYIMEQKVGLANLFWISAGVSLLLSLFWLLTSSKANVENNSSQSNLITKNK
ncbi:MFS transporter [Bacillus solimangrovi]|uniref:MFS transporter n=1 Tax=Bacillus solimangrovi TaxID=1305675 RepID=A0A1E5LET0_9BACI|nr:MFS transporter [Bacillus solimangrovi]